MPPLNYVTGTKVRVRADQGDIVLARLHSHELTVLEDIATLAYVLLIDPPLLVGAGGFVDTITVAAHRVEPSEGKRAA